DDDATVGRAFHRARAHLDVGRRREAAGLGRDSPERTAAAAFEAAAEVGARRAREVELARLVKALRERRGMSAERGEIRAERPSRPRRRPREPGHAQIPRAALARLPAR